MITGRPKIINLTASILSRTKQSQTKICDVDCLIQVQELGLVGNEEISCPNLKDLEWEPGLSFQGQAPVWNVFKPKHIKRWSDNSRTFSLDSKDWGDPKLYILAKDLLGYVSPKPRNGYGNGLGEAHIYYQTVIGEDSNIRNSLLPQC